ncbi:tetratricopeptide repeat protein [Rhabdochromatium marinum]|uniref:O-linked N-acetylglucosamine transferase, SPINDLY family protein n=1 Tax=Rhabdochromatium marinum TaxID=48729 RepID=UPI0019079ABB|nr:tetratricopeptide repeat protein [Rhabdochromatium marinum]
MLQQQAIPTEDYANSGAPEDLAAWLTRIESHVRDGQVQKALDSVHGAIAATGTQPGLLQLAQQLEQALRDTPPPEPWQQDLDHLTAIHDAGDSAEALPLAEAFIQQWPSQPQGFQRLAEIRHQLGDLLGALAAAREAVALDPASARSQVNLAVLLAATDALDEADACLRQALILNPHFDVAHATLGNLLRMRGDLPAAEVSYKRALALNPEQAQMHYNLGHVLEEQGQSEAAEQSYREALRIDPGFAQAHVQLGFILTQQRRYLEALAALARALVIDPDSVQAHGYRARVLMELGELEVSEAAYERALVIAPNNRSLRSNRLVVMAFCCHWPPERLRQEAEHWEVATLSAVDRQIACERVLLRAPRTGRRLRIGLLSNELRTHPVAFFLRAWLSELDRSCFEVWVYSSEGHEDAYTDMLKASADHWVSLAGLSDACAAERLLENRLDVLLETSGHDPGNRLGVIARRVAPVQCHYIGYYATTGLSQMDYFIGDAALIPPEHDVHFTEQVWRLPRTRYAYDPLEPAPAPRWWPDPDGRLWVGSFNRLTKVRDASLALWAEVLHALPEAYLALKDFKGDDRPLQLRVLKTLKACGIEENRVAFLKATPSWTEHMAYYNRLDIALDTLPFNSATTGFDALWMGCPLVTRIGDRLAGRQAASLLTGLGRTEWIAQSDDDFVRIAVELARDIDGRRRIRKTQREQMRHSELCDGPGLARALEAAFEAMFERWQASAGQAQ